MKVQTRKLALVGLFIALGLVLPFFTAQVPTIGRALLPMHIPVLLAGFVGGPRAGLITGLITPLLRSALFGTPPLFPTAATMTFELATYGFLAGLLYEQLPRRNSSVFVALVGSMIGGRIVWGIASLLLLGLSGSLFSWQAFMAGAFINAMPGIILQLVLIPVIVHALKRGNHLVESKKG